jgi:hypothetical protein
MRAADGTGEVAHEPLCLIHTHEPVAPGGRSDAAGCCAYRIANTDTESHTITQFNAGIDATPNSITLCAIRAGG